MRAGIGFPYECHSGGCGACKFDVLEGDIKTLWADAPGLSERERQRGKKLACQTLVNGDLRIKVRISDEHVPQVMPVRMRAVLQGVRQLTHDMSEFSFRTSCEANFLPGQYALVSIPALGLQRAYSMSNLKNQDGVWTFIVRKVPEGIGSTYLFEQLEIGSEVELDGPYGMAWMRPVLRDIVCIAGGSGLAPMLSIAKAAMPVLQKEGRRLHFYSGVRTTNDLAAASELKLIARESDCLRCIEVVSETSAGNGWSGPTGFVHEEVNRALGEKLADHEIYFAGPPPMAQALLELLMVQRRVPYTHIHFDRFF